MMTRSQQGLPIPRESVKILLNPEGFDMDRLTMAIEQIQGARAYTLKLLDTISPDEWYVSPIECVTHVAWQVGHLAMAEYRLCLERVRGKRPEDAELLPPDFLARFGRGSTPDPDVSEETTPERILEVLERVHAQVMLELPRISQHELDEPPFTPHELFKTKLGALQWASLHEMLHAGQIGLLRRLLGQTPIW